MNATKVFLSGGPYYLTNLERTREVVDPEETLKVPFGAGYEHFMPTGELRDVDGVPVRVFEWCTRTLIAE